jgi:hypothetical protein
MLKRTVAITNDLLEPITLVLAYPTLSLSLSLYIYIFIYLFILFLYYLKTWRVNCDIERTKQMIVFQNPIVRPRKNNGICLVVTSLSIVSLLTPNVAVSNMSVIITSSDNAQYYIIALENERTYGKKGQKKWRERRKYIVSSLSCPWSGQLSLETYA